MLTTFLFFVAFLAAVNGNRCTNKSYIEIYHRHNHSHFACWPPVVCQDGQEESVHPGSVHPSGTHIECLMCPKGFFSNKKTGHKCRKCVTCGNKQELLTCTLDRDRLCSNSCISRNFYFNATDRQCYPCTECCGANTENVEPQCLLSMAFRVGITVIGGSGALHCKMRSAQLCDDMLKKSNVTPHSSQPSPTERKMFDVNPESSQPGATERKLENSLLDRLHITLMCCLVGCVLVIVFLVFILWRNRRESCQDRYCCFRFWSSLSGERCMTYEMAPCVMPFQEKLKHIPDDLKIDSIPSEVEDKLRRLDAKLPYCKTWFDVGRKLGVSVEDLNLIKREDDREGGSPTTQLLSLLRNFENVVTLRKFVTVLHELRRNDIANAIFEIYTTQASSDDHCNA